MTHHEIRVPLAILASEDVDTVELFTLKDGTTIVSSDAPFMDDLGRVVFRFVTEHPDDPEPEITLSIGDN